MPVERPHRRLALTPPTAVPAPGEQHSPPRLGDEDRKPELRAEVVVDESWVEMQEAQIARLADQVERLTVAVERLAATQQVAVTRTFRVEASSVPKCFPTSRVGSLHRERGGVVVTPSNTGDGNEVRNNSTKVSEVGVSDQENDPCQLREKIAAPALDRVFIQVRTTGR